MNNLTHEQACFYRGVLAGESPMCPAEHIDANGPVLRLTDAGRKALAAYNAEWVMVRRDTLKGLVEFGMGLSCCDPISDELDDATQALEATS